MKEIIILSQAPELVEERVLDDRATQFCKQIVERVFKMPDGKVLPVLCISNPRADSSIVFPLTAHGTVFLINQFRFGINGWVLELPGGCPKPGQSWEDAARAELLEEVGAEARGMEIIGREMKFNPAVEDLRFTAVLATGCRIIGPQNLDSTEFITVKEVSLKEFRGMLKRGDITDAKTVATGYLALDHLGLLG